MESEFYGLANAASESVGERSFAMDLGVKLELSISIDATAGYQLSQVQWSNETSRHVVPMGARKRVERR